MNGSWSDRFISCHFLFVKSLSLAVQGSFVFLESLIRERAGYQIRSRVLYLLAFVC